MPDTRSGKSLNKELGDRCKEFNNNKTYNKFIELLNDNPKYINRNKCRICGNDLFYDNVEFIGPYQKYPTLSKGTTPFSYKTINGVKYNLHVCEKCMREKFPEWDEKNKSKIFNMPNKYSSYAFGIPEDEILLKKNELCIRSKEGFVEKYGSTEGEKRWNEYREKQRYTNTFEYKHKKYGITEEEFEKFNKSRACTLENFINRYGEDEGLIKWKNYIKRESYTNTKEYFIEEYGEDIGTKKWDNFNNAKKIYLGYSQISQELFYSLLKQEVFSFHEIYFAEHGGEYEIENSSGKKYYLDFFDKTANICIEFNGVRYHPKPGLYNDTDIFKSLFNKKEYLVKDLWDKEQKRIDDLESEFGIRTIIVWEDDYKKNKMKCICDIINKILELQYDRTI